MSVSPFTPLAVGPRGAKTWVAMYAVNFTRLARPGAVKPNLPGHGDANGRAPGAGRGVLEAQLDLMYRRSRRRVLLDHGQQAVAVPGHHDRGVMWPRFR